MSRERLECPEVDRHGVGDELVVELGAQDDDRLPKRLLLGFTRRPLELVLLTFLVAAADRGGEEPVELIA